MMSKRTRNVRRGKNDVIPCILASADGGATRKEIVYACNIPYTRLRGYLGVLVAKDLLTFDDEDKRTIRTTPKGLQALDVAKALHEIVEI